jgi:hypothetical protein
MCIGKNVCRVTVTPVAVGRFVPIGQINASGVLVEFDMGRFFYFIE